ncbi:hypothetical protein MBM09_13995 [Flaviramulus sp. BrNp1-15]|uniref:hypothetical protein n=1 Tax=Flaviramulus sp. BrNp1-15 TaxID=2916754 RepID=UPI001EE7C0C3|nr:hypothetical protein [Flaviramulus sp. BrNp1-15]ULC59014.1 hypothetical protein MBM09_13995 [Flaviramulus sp. BrNp1-15]
MKSTLLATIIFWLIIFTENFESDMIPFILLSIIPISICCAITITTTIVPFFWLQNEGTSNSKIFKTYFPFYAIVSFGLCFYGALESLFTISFFASAFFTTMQSWVWFGREKTTN